MIENGLEYSYITTGETFVFLRILAEDPTTLYYHVTVPVDEIADEELAAEGRTAVAQVVVLSLLALHSQPRGHHWRQKAKAQLSQHPSDNYETIVLRTPIVERQLGRQKVKNSPLYKAGRKGSVESKYNIRSWGGKGNPRGPPDGGSGNIGSSSSSANVQNRLGSLSMGKNTGSHNEPRGSDRSNRQRQYCTQKCLLGITRGLPLDRNCPNASLHPQLLGRHSINIWEFMPLIQKQLAECVDYECEPLGLQGARGALFKIALVSHGYVFVGKGTVPNFVPDLLHEGCMYERLEALQGTAIPVCLGNIYLDELYYLDLGVRISHMLLLSWAGTSIANDGVTKDGLQSETQRTVNEVRQAGIDQCDVRSPNLLWNEETQRVMLIDFERAVEIPQRPAMEEASPNKRRNPFDRLTSKTKRHAKTEGKDFTPLTSLSP